MKQMEGIMNKHANIRLQNIPFCLHNVRFQINVQINVRVEINTMMDKCAWKMIFSSNENIISFFSLPQGKQRKEEKKNFLKY